jgi:hypothetical protein
LSDEGESHQVRTAASIPWPAAWGPPDGGGEIDRSSGSMILDFREGRNHIGVIFLPFVEKMAPYGPEWRVPIASLP